MYPSLIHGFYSLKLFIQMNHLCFSKLRQRTEEMKERRQERKRGPRQRLRTNPIRVEAK